MKIHRQDSTNAAPLSDFYRVDSIPRTTKAQEMILWRKYIKWRHMQRIPELRIALRNRGNAGPDILCGCDLERVLSRIIGEITSSHDLIVLLRHHLELDRLGDTVIEGDEDDANVTIELYRLMQYSKAGQDNRVQRDNSESCCLEDLFGFMLGETLNNIAFGKGNLSLVSKIVKATNAVQHNIEGRLYRLAINRGLLPKSLLKFVDPKTPLRKLPHFIESMPSESSSKLVSEYYQPFVLGIRAEGEKALARIIESHLWLAVDIAKKYSTENAGGSLDDFVQESSPSFIETAEDEDLGFPLGDLTRTRSVGLIEVAERKDLSLPLDDLIQEAAIGLIIAAEKFQPNQGTRYMSYAGPWAFQRIYRAMEDQARIIRVPAHMIERISNLVKVSDRLVQELGREPSLPEMGSRMGLAPDKVEDILTVAQLPVSLYSPLGDDKESFLSDFLEDETFVSPVDAVSDKQLKEQINKLLTDLKPKEREVIELRFGLKDGHARTLEEVGIQFNLTRERIRQIEGNALRRLRHPTRSKWLKGYLS